MTEKIESKQIYNFLEGMKVDSKFEFIEDASKNPKLKEILDKANLKTDNRDLGFFHNIYAIVDKANKNKCILPKAKVEAGLSTIRQKPVNAEHNRTSVLGHYLDAELVGEEIHSYGCIYKSCFPEKWEEAKKLFKSGKLNSSFEIWCPKEKRTYKANGDFTLDDIDIAGGALLFKAPPAFDEAKVLEMAKEIATQNNSMVYSYDENDMLKCSVEMAITDQSPEISRLYASDIPWIQKLINEVTCPVCNRDYVLEANVIDLENLKAETKCYFCESSVNVDLDIKAKTDVTKKGKVKKVSIVDKAEIEELSELEKQDIDEGVKLTYKQRKNLKDSDFALVQTVDEKKVRRFPIVDESHVRNALARLSQAKGLSEEERESAKKKILKKAKELNMTSILEKYNKNKGGVNMDELRKAQEKIEVLEKDLKAKDTVIASKDEALGKKDEEINSLKTKVTEVEEAKKVVETERDTVKAEIARRDEEIKQSTLKARKEELGEEYIKANSVKDEDLLDNIKFENMKLKKENAELKDGRPTSAMIAGTRTKSKDDIQKAHDAVEADAYSYAPEKK